MTSGPAACVYREIPLEELDTDPAFQHRVLGLDPKRVDKYAQVLIDGGEFKDPPVVFEDRAKRKLWLPGGFHRLAASQKAGRETMLCEVRPGDWHAAMRHSLGENIHGLDRSHADKRQHVLDAIAYKEKFKLHWKDRETCRWAGVGPAYLTNMRQQMRALESSNSDQRPPQSAASETDRGRKPPPSPPTPDRELAEEEGACAAEAVADALASRRRADPDPREPYREKVAQGLHLVTAGLTALGKLDTHRAALDAMWEVAGGV